MPDNNFFLSKFIIIFFISFIPVLSNGQTGINRSFFPDGKIESEISYIDDKLDGTSYWFFENGNLKKEITYSSGVINGWIREYFPSGIIKSEIKVLTGIKDGMSKYYYENGGLKEIETYNKGRLIKIDKVSLDPNYTAPKSKYFSEISGIQNSSKRKEEYICQVAVCPEPAGGIETVIENLIYPEDARKYGLEGTVSLVASIDEYGNVISTQVVKGIGLGCDEAAAEAVKKTQFIPAQDKGEVVSADVIVYVPFSLKSPRTDGEIKRKGKTANQSGKAIAVKKDESKLRLKIIEISCDAQECPYPVGGLDSLSKNIYIDRRNNLSAYKGELTFQLKIDESGKVLYSKIINTIDKKIDENIEAGIIITEFNPGVSSGQPVQSNLTIKLGINQ